MPALITVSSPILASWRLFACSFFFSLHSSPREHLAFVTIIKGGAHAVPVPHNLSPPLACFHDAHISFFVSGTLSTSCRQCSPFRHRFPTQGIKRRANTGGCLIEGETEAEAERVRPGHSREEKRRARYSSPLLISLARPCSVTALLAGILDECLPFVSSFSSFHFRLLLNLSLVRTYTSIFISPLLTYLIYSILCSSVCVLRGLDFSDARFCPLHCGVLFFDTTQLSAMLLLLSTCSFGIHLTASCRLLVVSSSLFPLFFPDPSYFHASFASFLFTLSLPPLCPSS